MHLSHLSLLTRSRSKGNQLYVAALDRIVLKDVMAHRAFANTSTCRKAVITTRILQLVHELCSKRIHVTKRDLFYTDVKLFEVCTGGLSTFGVQDLETWKWKGGFSRRGTEVSVLSQW